MAETLKVDAGRDRFDIAIKRVEEDHVADVIRLATDLVTSNKDTDIDTVREKFRTAMYGEDTKLHEDIEVILAADELVDVPTITEISVELQQWLFEQERSEATYAGSSDISRSLFPIAVSVLESMPNTIAGRLDTRIAMIFGFILRGLINRRGLRFEIERHVGKAGK